MAFIIGFAVWITIGVVGGMIVNAAWRGPGTTMIMSIIFGFFGAFIAGMLGMSPYIFHDPLPLRIGGLIGATLGGLGFPFIYHFIAKKAV